MYGPGGIGKSTLLRRMMDHARTAGRLLVPAWSRPLHVTELEPLSEEQARRLLVAAEIRPELRDRVPAARRSNPSDVPRLGLRHLFDQ
ncbi:hypothetical protein [Streptomyces hiroshimensis]|uniref:ATP-binding protein n=1 Tax=Streptomyces hiroshimensis TaxID=66424 RepID=A0ABQ2YAC7_9ACTN|nr:hypothetical protein [Streptomyces hiroshimensis]GGX74505.1 hypothetical protein GCM10010324_19800 [Streptomyces hiroshimensis]